MKDRTPLVLSEMAVMLLIFALAAALCLQCFAWADRESRRTQAESMACNEAANACEVLKACRGDYAAAAAFYGGEAVDGGWVVYYDESFHMIPSGEGCAYLMAAAEAPDEALPLLGKAEVCFNTAEGEQLFALTAGWQKEGMA